MKEILVSLLLCVGALFVLLSAVGVVRLPDVFTRMQATTKATTLGTACLMLALAIRIGTLGAWFRAAVIICFIYLTAPVAAHTIARAAYFVGCRLWPGTVVDELKDRYDKDTHRLH